VHWSGYEWLLGLFLLLIMILSLTMASRKKYAQMVLVLFTGNVIVTEMALVLIAPRIERYTQGAVIDFYESLKDKDCYAESLNYLSYAPYFYTNKQPPLKGEVITRDELLVMPLKKEVYFVSKINLHQQNVSENKNIVEIARRNGWVFYKRTGMDTTAAF
jgi:hypothetical protein